MSLDDMSLHDLDADDLVADVAVSLRRRSTLVDAAATDRITARVTRARRRARRRLVGGSVAAIAVLAGGVAAALTASSAEPAFAGWTARPSPGADVTAATTACSSRLASMPGGPGRVTWRASATDVRGPYVLEALASGSLTATCLAGPAVTSVSVDGGSLSSASTPGGGDPGGTSSTSNYGADEGVAELELSSLDTSHGAPFDTLEGAVSPAVTAVTLTLGDGQRVRATISGRLLLAWWPDGSAPVTAEVTTALGTTGQALGPFGPGPGAIVHASRVAGDRGSLHVESCLVGAGCRG